MQLPLRRVSCPNCHSLKPKAKYQAQGENPFTLAHFSQSFMGRVHPAYSICTRCGLWYCPEIPAPEDLRRLYQPLNDEAYLQEWGWRQVNDKVAVRQLNQVLQKGFVLEIGCGQGSMLKQLSTHYSAIGIDLSLPHLRQAVATGANAVLQADGSRLPFPDESFHAVVAMHVIEHTAEPVSLIQEIHRVLKPEGYLLLETPDTSGFLAKVAGNKWWYLMPYHLHLWPKKTLVKTLEMSNFQIKYTGVPQRVWSLGYLLNRAAYSSPRLQGIATWVNARNLADTKLSLRPPDLVRLLAQKKLFKFPGYREG